MDVRYSCLVSTAARDGQSIAYDPETRPVRVDSGATICRFAYDGDSVRRKRLDSQGTIHYLGPYERNVGNGLNPAEVVTKYYTASFGGLSRLIAFRRAGTLYWVGTDHLGSTIRVANSSFTAMDGMRYRPFGISRDAGTNLQTDHKFTSQIEDQVIGLYWYNSRAYDPAIGRFVAPDTIVPEPRNPQSLNRYSCTLNNPLKYTDRTGHAAEDLQHLEPGWYDQAWHDEFVNNNNREPEAVDYVYRFVSMGVANSYSGEDIMRPVTIAIGTGLSPSGPGLWSQPLDQTSAGQERAEWDQRKATGSYLEYPSPYDLDERYFGANFTEYRWGKIRIVMGAGGSRGGLVRFLGGNDNATTFSADLIVFAGTPDLDQPEGRRWLLHELRHVMQAQALGVNYLPLYIQLWRPWPLQTHDDHPMERDAISFADKTKA